ncbi:N-acetylmuramoyl-L-alanine amidase [Pseudalkalibacillus sp. SCS-8]|uniref:N-acetylmuramoyl-L-alanine amidase n=1 Tax=Pseudalkalibacillus nanhaiensis TaxID=3115291 RepID=UPI0032DBDBE5
MVTVVLDPGHGGSDSGAVYKQYREKDFNLKVALMVREFLLESYVVKVLMTRAKDETVSLKERTDFANKKNADYFFSIHHNAAGGSGFESFIYNGNINNSTKVIQGIIHKEIVFTMDKYNVFNRGQKRANFYVLRNTRMNAMLIEVLFIDNEKDLKLMLNDKFLRDVAMATATGIAKALNLPRKEKPKPKPEPVPGTIYKVIAGSFKEEENAKDRAEMLASKKIDSYIYPVKINGTTFYRVQAGAYSERKNAEEQVEMLVKLGISGAFIVIEGPSEPEKPEKPEEPTPEPIKGFTIQGESVLTADTMNQFVRNVNPKAPALAQLYLNIGKLYGIRGDTAFAQAIHETNYFKFTGTVKPEQNNYAGIGTTGPSVPGASFKTPREGVLAHIQHLYAYATKAKLPDGQVLVDPRFNLVARGSAPTWVMLNGKWAVPGTTYGQMILSIYEKMINLEVENVNKLLDDLEKTKQQLDE